MSNAVRKAVEGREIGKGPRASAAARKCVLLAMADRANDDGGGVWCSKTSLSDLTEFGKSTVKLAVKELVVEGLVAEVGKRWFERGYTVEYRIILEAVASLEVNSYGRRSDAQKKAKASPKGGRCSTPWGPVIDPVGGLPPTPNHPLNHPLTIQNSLRIEPPFETESRAREAEDYLERDPEFQKFVSAQQRISK